jgi:hypothetical protein
MKTFQITAGSKFTWASYSVTAQDEADDFAYRICDVELIDEDAEGPASIAFLKAGLNG